jgi:hypothetical protein
MFSNSDIQGMTGPVRNASRGLHVLLILLALLALAASILLPPAVLAGEKDYTPAPAPSAEPVPPGTSGSYASAAYAAGAPCA